MIKKINYKNDSKKDQFEVKRRLLDFYGPR